MFVHQRVCLSDKIVESMTQFMTVCVCVCVCVCVEVDRISASVLVLAPNVDKWALSADIRFRPKAVVSHSVHFRFRRAAVDKFGGCRK